MNFRTLQANEIECRVGTQDKGLEWCTLLLYKDARVDQRLLDEVVGATHWQRSHELIDGQLFCTVSIYDADTKQWVSKQDVGTESNTEKEKGRASDAFKRACFNWGIGRELYSAPLIFINVDESEFKVNTKGEKSVKTTFEVKEIGYDDNRNINKLTIVDGKGRVRFTMGGKGGNVTKSEAKKAPEPTPAPAPAFDLQGTKLKICGIATYDEGKAIFLNTPKEYQAEIREFIYAQYDILGIKYNKQS